jgi:hypothetical protein
MYKTYIIGICMILYGVSGLILDIYEGRSPNVELYLHYIFMGAGMLGLRLAIKEK